MTRAHGRKELRTPPREQAALSMNGTSIRQVLGGK
jgi:hypothetical protein